MRSSLRLSAIFGVLSLALATQSAYAQSSASAGNVAVAQTLFDDARALIKAGNYADACPKLEESQRLDAGPGTQFNLADCYEHVGRTASAWAQFVAVADASRAAGQRDREKVARERAKALEPKLTRLTINVPAANRASGLEVRRDGEAIRDVQWGSAVPVDPGKHTLAASAPGREPWQQAVEVAGGGKTTAIDVPMLAAAAQSPPLAALTPTPTPIPASPPPQAPPVADDTPPSSGSGRRTLALVVGGVGLVGVGVGSYFGLQAFSKHSDYTSHCANNLCDAEGLKLHDDAKSDATISTIVTGVGLAALAGGVVLWLTAPSDSPRSGVRVVPVMTAHSGRFMLEGSW